MEFNLEVVKRRPYLIGGIVLVVGGYVFYRIYKGSASPSDLSSESQFQALQSAQQLQNSQIQGQLDLQQGQSTAQIAVIDASYAGQINLAKQGQSVYDDYLGAQLAMNDSNNATTIGVAQIQSNTSTDIAQMQADLYSEEIAVAQSKQTAINDLIAKAGASEYRLGAQSTGWAQVLASAQAGSQPAPWTGGFGFNVGIPGVGSVGVTSH
jgi:hypothetical protein